MSTALQPVVSDDRAAHRERIKARALPRLERMIAQSENKGETRWARAYTWARDELVRDNPLPAMHLRRLVRFPVTIEEFAQSKEFVGVLDDFAVWPKWQEQLRAMNPDVVCGEAPVHEISLGGASGTGKTTVAHINVAYQCYLASCFGRPQFLYRMPHVTPVVIPLMSLKPSIARDILYAPFRSLMEAMPYVRRFMPWDRNRDSALHFTEQNIVIQWVLAMDTSMQSQAVMGAIFDEMAFMEVLESSKRVPGPRGQGGRFDQAELVYRAGVNRRNRNFLTKGVSVGTLCVLSNTRYQGDFMDRHLALLSRSRRPHVYFKRMKRHLMKPDDLQDMARGDTIRVLVGASGYSSRVLEAGERAGADYPVEARVESVPAKYRHQFTDDCDGALREVCGIATGVISPYLSRREMIAAMFARGKKQVSWVDEQDVDLTERGLPKWVPENMPNDRHIPRFVHVDLSRSKDRCGVAVIKVAGMAHVLDPEAPGTPERAPHFIVEVAVTIKPSGTAQIDPAEVRSWLMELGTVHGFEIGGASYDGFDSRESLSRWVKAGVRNVRVIGTDRTTETWDHFRHALYQGRINCIASGILESELLELEYHAEKDRVDHPPKGSKDLADAVACAVINAAQSRGVRKDAGYVDEDTGERVRVRARGKTRKPGRRMGGNTARRVVRDRLRQSREG